jgi:hypothetical protein
MSRAVEFEKAAMLLDQVKELTGKLSRKIYAAGVGTRGKVK